MSYEEAIVGERFNMGEHVFTDAEIATFKQTYDPLVPFFTAAENRPVASAMHVCCVHMRLLIESLGQDIKSVRARGNSGNLNGPSPGVRDLAWPKPVHAGDRVRFVRILEQKRTSASRPGWGIVTFRSLGYNQNDDVVMSMSGTGFVKLRGA